MNQIKKDIQEKLDWSVIQSEMKKKIGSDIFESWFKKN